ncbi:MAG: hypothetical protein KGK10_04555 [Rhodospirillales bacterium]|nr:hypothetical protein [Rhodospirillales bacterium]
MTARGAVALHGGRIHGIGEFAGVSGEYQCQGDLVLGMLDLVLHATDARGDAVAERVQLHIQGNVAATTMAASGTDPAEPGRRFALSLQYRCASVADVAAAHGGRAAAGGRPWADTVARPGAVPGRRASRRSPVGLRAHDPGRGKGR